MGVQIAPSILSADFTHLADEVRRVGDTADWIHVDVMDNHFVPNLTIGLPVVEQLVSQSPLPLDCHLMIEDPDRWAPGYAEAGAGSVTFHIEAAQDPGRAGPDTARGWISGWDGIEASYPHRAVLRPLGRGGHGAADDR